MENYKMKEVYKLTIENVLSPFNGTTSFGEWSRTPIFETLTYYRFKKDLIIEAAMEVLTHLDLVYWYDTKDARIPRPKFKVELVEDVKMDMLRDAELAFKHNRQCFNNNVIFKNKRGKKPLFVDLKGCFVKRYHNRLTRLRTASEIESFLNNLSLSEFKHYNNYHS